MARKETKCPKNLNVHIERARLFPVTATDDNIREFEKSFAAIIFRPFGYHWKLNKEVIALGPDVEHDVVERPIREGLAQEIKTKHGIHKDYIELALSLGLVPGEKALSDVLWRTWASCNELRGLARKVFWYFDRQTREKTSIATGQLLYLQRSSFYTVNKNATLAEGIPAGFERKKPDVLSIIVDEEIPIDRIRICSECSHVFWAHRTTKWACGPVCSQKLSRRKKEKENGSL